VFQIISILVFAVVALAPVAQEDIRIKSQSMSFSRTVVDQTGSEIPGVLVERLGLIKTAIWMNKGIKVTREQMECFLEVKLEQPPRSTGGKCDF
jgi:hypothetical protein